MLQAEIKVFDHPDDLICACEKLRPHIYILDIVMPMVNGIQTARELKCYHLLSGKTISTSTLRIGFAEYLVQNHEEDDIVLCHESVAVNIQSIDKLTKTEVMVRNREILPVAKSRYAQVAEKYINYRFH